MKYPYISYGSFLVLDEDVTINLDHVCKVVRSASGYVEFHLLDGKEITRSDPDGALWAWFTEDPNGTPVHSIQFTPTGPAA